jgi:DNA polymerase-1
MIDLSQIQGATADLDNVLPEKAYPEIVKGRTAHIDADFLAYMAAYERKDEVNVLEDILYRADVMIEDKRRECGAEFAVLHLTPNTSDKGGRYEAAIQKQYQGQRSSDRKPQYLEAVREYMAGFTGDVAGRAWQNAEADDGMSEAAWKSHGDGTSNECVIATKDKDLRMCPGLHLDWDSGAITDCGRDTFGWIGIKERTGKSGKVTKKHDGFGTKFFWFQMLMGDTADNIKGCPKALIDGKHKLCGLVGAYSLLKDASTDAECLRIVMDAYKSNSYTHWQTGADHTWQEVFLSEAHMLWMQRTAGKQDDVKHWIKGLTT